MIAIVDYGLSNLLSIKRSIDLFDTNNIITEYPKDVLNATKIILPGVGAFQYGMECLNEKKLSNALIEAANNGIPILGICLGMQMLFDSSTEGGFCNGLGLISGTVQKIDVYDSLGNSQNVPHIGWEKISLYDLNKEWPDILQNTSSSDEFYFVHSYYGVVNNTDNLKASVEYGGKQMSAVVQNKNIFGCQFHPEKSAKAGLKIIKNFVNL